VNKPYVISFEGVDNCGKDTQINLTRDYLRERSVPFTVEKEPGTTSFGTALRMLLKHPSETYTVLNDGFSAHRDFDRINSINQKKGSLSELLGFLASRAEFVEKIVAPAIMSGTTLIANRHMDSTTAYQGFGLFGGDQKIMEIIQDVHYAMFEGREELRPVRTFM